MKTKTIDYTAFLQVAEDGNIWWLQTEAIRLGAGFVPADDEGGKLGTRLAPPNGRARANEKALIRAFQDERLTIARPMTFERDGLRYVAAAAFLNWLSQYISQQQAKIDFPSELVDAVRIARAKASAERPVRTPEEFRSLTLALESDFDKPLGELSEVLRQRVVQEFFPLPWDELSVDQRKSAARQLDYQHDPATAQDRQLWWDISQRRRQLEKQIETWERTAAPTASDLALKESRLTQLHRELGHIDQDLRRGSLSYSRRKAENEQSVPTEGYVAFPRALQILTDRLGATREELAAWIFIGPQDGGIAAYINANELTPPPRFHFSHDMGPDFVAPMMACWFNLTEIQKFTPADRYITGKALLDRWKGLSSIDPSAFIRAKIGESRLIDIHPTMGSALGDPRNPDYTSALFVLSHIEEVEEHDFATSTSSKIVSATEACVSVSAEQIKRNFRVHRDDDKNDSWWARMMRDAKRNKLIACRVGTGKTGPGGSLWRPDKVAEWLSAENSKGSQWMSVDRARSGLKKFPGFDEVADTLFPGDE